MSIKTKITWIAVGICGAASAIASELAKNVWPETKEWALKKVKELREKKEESE